MQALARLNQGDLPALLDILTVAVTTLDAVGVESFRELYLYVMGTTGEEIVRDLRVEDGQLIVGPPADGVHCLGARDHEYDRDRRALLLAELGSIMRIWKWSLKAMSGYLRCSEAMLSTWVGRSAFTEIPVLPNRIIDRINRLSMIERTRQLAGIPDQDVPRWLSARRACFSRRSIDDLIRADEEGANFVQLVMWGLNSRRRTDALH